jgi:GH43 family beta-xylosidase
MQVLDGELYMYFSHQDQDNNDYWRQYVMKAVNASDPMGQWEPAIEVLPDWHQDAIDGTVLEHGGKRYLVWNDGHSGFAAIYIAALASPSETTGHVAMIKYPAGRHECEGRCTSEAPHFIIREERTYMVLTTSAPLHRLTYSSITPDKDPMDPASWVDVGETVFDANPEELVFNVGHACFTDSPDGTEVWMMHAGNRNSSVFVSYIAIEKIDFKEDGTPIFPKAHGWNHYQPVPSGERH